MEKSSDDIFNIIVKTWQELQHYYYAIYGRYSSYSDCVGDDSGEYDADDTGAKVYITDSEFIWDFLKKELENQLTIADFAGIRDFKAGETIDGVWMELQIMDPTTGQLGHYKLE